MPFNPDQFLSETEPSGFNPDAYLAKTEPKEREHGFFENAGRATVNALPMLGGVAGGILGTPADVISGPGGNIAGAGIGGYLGTAAKNAINSYIDPDQAPKTLGQAALDPVVGGVTQAAMEGVGQAVAPVLSAGMSKALALKPEIVEYLNRLAEIKSAKALGATKAAFRSEGEDALRKTGRYALDEGLYGRLTGAETMADRNAAVGQNAMAERQKIYDAIDSGSPRPVGADGAPNPNTLPMRSPQPVSMPLLEVNPNTLPMRGGSAPQPQGVYPPTVTPNYPPLLRTQMTPRKIGGVPMATESQLAEMRMAEEASQSANLASANESGYNPHGPASPMNPQTSEALLGPGSGAAPASGPAIPYDTAASPLNPQTTEALLGPGTPAAPASAGSASYGPQSTAGASQFNPLEAAQAVEGKAGNFNQASPLNSGKKTQLQSILDAIRLRGSDNISMNEAQALQEEIQNAGNYDATRSTGANTVAKNAAGASREYLNQAAENAADQVGGQGFKQTMQKANQQYSQGRNAAELLNNRTSSELGNKTFGLTDTILAAGAGNPAAAVAEVGVKKTLEKYGNQNIAKNADWLRGVVEKSPESLGRWAGPLSQAAARGGNSLPATDFILQSTDPEYREHLRALQGNPDQQGDQ